MKRLGRRDDDQGATLVLALLIITTIALVVGAILGQAASSVSQTVSLRDEAGSAYNADGAGQAAVNALRQGSFNNTPGTQCFGASSTLTLPNFYPQTGGQHGSAASSAAVRCTSEAGTGAQGAPVPISSANKPGQAILTLGTSPDENGQLYGQSNKTITIRGSVTSNSNINSNSANLSVIGPGAGVRAVTACTGVITPTPACNSGAPGDANHPGDPNYPPPTDAPAPPASMPACNKNSKIAEFQPGLYTDATKLNNCQASWMYFNPGTYYFDFTNPGGSTAHVLSFTGTAVGGTLTGAKTDTPPTVPGACVNPITSTSAVGVQFVFGGDSQINFLKGGNAEFCASYRQTSIPTVFYGLKSDIANGANVVHKQAGCVVQVNGCDLISDNGNGTKPNFFFEGFVYAPWGSINIAVNNSTQPFFNFGLIARKLVLTTTGSACTPPACAPFISLPDDTPGYGITGTVVNLAVYVCPGASTCAATGLPALTARVKIDDPTGSPVPGARQMTVLSWSSQR